MAASGPATGAVPPVTDPTTLPQAATSAASTTAALTASSRTPLLAGMAIGALLAAGAAYVAWTRPAGDTAGSSSVAIADTSTPETVRSRLALATASLEAHNYRAAAAYAGEVLAIEPAHVDALRIASESRAMLSRFDAAIADARARIAAADLAGGTRALESARALDPTAPTLIELSARLADLARERQAATRDDRPSAARVPATPVVQSAPAPVAPPAASAAVVSNPSVPPAGPPAAMPPTVPVPAPAPAALPSAPNQSSAPVTAAVPPAAMPAAPAGSTAEQDEAAIRRIIAAYARAIETKDLNLFRSIKPNLSREEERRLEQGFRVVTSQRVNLTVVSIDRQATQATVVVQRRDTIVAGGREQTAESQQSLRLSRAGGGWVIVDIR